MERLVNKKNKTGKKIFLIWGVDKRFDTARMIAEFEKKGHKVVYVVHFEKIIVPGTDFVYHDNYKAGLGEPAEGISYFEFPPASLDLVKKMQETESVVLTMMNRMFDNLCVDERKHIYYEMLGYWDGVLKKYKPDIIIFAMVPHSIYNYILYSLAKLYGIKTVMFEDTWISDRLLKYYDLYEGSPELKDAIRRHQGRNFITDDLSDDLKEHFLTQSNSGKEDFTPVYINFFKGEAAGLNILKKKIKALKNTLKDGVFLKYAWNYALKFFMPNLKREYENLEVMPDFNKNFVYVTLAFQPERTTSPQGDIFTDQILMIEILSSSLPENWVIYVKEHPAEWVLKTCISYSSSRYAGYYKRIARLPNVKIVPIGTNNYELIKNCRALAACAGTAGWEAIIRGKPVLNFGYPWYRDFPGAFRITDVSLCKLAFKKIMDGFKPSEKMIINYLKSFDEASVHGYIEFNFMHKGISKLDEKEDTSLVTGLLLKELAV
ncbi:MAG: hypothetical protein WCT19_03220 [Candidatus Paceibacterota bacterium]